MEQMLYNKDFLPVVSIGQHLKLIPTEKFVRVTFIESVPNIEKDLGAVNSESETTEKKMSDLLEVFDNEILHVRIDVVDDIQIYLYEPRGLARHGIKYVTGYITAEDSLYADSRNHAEYFVYQDDVLFLKAKNPTKYNLVRSKVKFQAWRYRFEEVKRPEHYTTIPIRGIAGVSK